MDLFSTIKFSSKFFLLILYLFFPLLIFRSTNVPNNDNDSSGSITSIQTALDKLGTQRDELGELWATRKLRLDLCLQLRIFERDALEV